MIKLCREYRCPVHIVHLAAAEAALGDIEKAKDEGLPFTVETCPHYLFFAAEDVPDGDPRFKCAPPIRPGGNAGHLWYFLEFNLIDTVGSDHSPAPPNLKHLGSGDLRRAWGGIASLQLSLPAVWTARVKGGHPCRMDTLVLAMATRPAALVGLAGRKGAIAPGCDADLVVFDPDATWTVSAAALHHRHKATPYDGRELRGLIESTYLRGRKVYDRGEHLDGPSGELLERPALV